MKALRQLEYGKPLQVCEIPIPQAQVGSAIVRILAAGIVSYTKDVYNGVRKYPYPTPLTVGAFAIGRIHDFGPDNTSLKKDQLVVIDITFRSRSDPRDVFLSAIHQGFTSGSPSLMSYWRDGSYAEYMACPLENVYPLPEALLTPAEQGGFGYKVEDLLYIPKALISYGGLADIGLRPSETVLIAPATGGFGSAAVHLALSMGARVIAMGRNQDVLASIQSNLAPHFPAGRVVTVPIEGDVDSLVSSIKTAAGSTPIDCFFDISPAAAANAPFFKAAILSIRHSGRVSLMGGQTGDVGIPLTRVMHWNLSLRGKWMYDQQDVRDLIRMVETGTLLLGERGGVRNKSMKSFKLEDWEAAFEYAEQNIGLGIGAYFKIADDE